MSEPLAHAQPAGEPHEPVPALREDARLLRAGESVLLIDEKGREYLRELRPGRRFSLHAGNVDASALIGLPDGSRVSSSLGQKLLVFRPTYARLIPALPRQAQVIYPKDAASILVWGDIYPGAQVVEVGVGPGALTLALLRGVGPSGRLTSIERREDHATMARENVARFHGEAANWEIIVAEAADALPARRADRVVIDVPEPERLVAAAATALRPGGVLVAYVPTTIQLQALGDALRDEVRLAASETFETLQRFWHVAANSLRPDHRMVAHTGFITTAWRLGDPSARPGTCAQP
jgi:tRNA (adenine57-N1/adenine58-N1)-methyltransferase catalytic subunit